MAPRTQNGEFGTKIVKADTLAQDNLAPDNLAPGEFGTSIRSLTNWLTKYYSHFKLLTKKVQLKAFFPPPLFLRGHTETLKAMLIAQEIVNNVL